MKTLQSESGFTLIEALIAMLVLSIGIFSLYSMQTTSIRGNSRASRITTASTWNADQVERVIGMQYTNATLRDIDNRPTGSNRNGTNQDTDGDGVDDIGVAGFGLDDTTGASTPADGGPITTADGRYTLYFNVAVDVPMQNLKTIRVHVQDNGQMLSRPVTFTYIKDDII